MKELCFPQDLSPYNESELDQMSQIMRRHNEFVRDPNASQTEILLLEMDFSGVKESSPIIRKLQEWRERSDRKDIVYK